MTKCSENDLNSRSKNATNETMDVGANEKITDGEVGEYVWVGVPDSTKNSHPLALGRFQQR